MLLNKIKKNLAKLSLAKVGLVMVGIAIAPLFSPLASASRPEQATAPNAPLADGVYLYGQSPEPEQLGQEYMVFQVDQGEVVGASYLPRSEFSCFSGSIDSERMSLAIVHPYTEEVYSYSIPVQENISVAAAGNGIPRFVQLVGYQPLEEISDNDRRMLDICLENYQ